MNYVIEFMIILYYNNLGYIVLNIVRVLLLVLGFVIDGYFVGFYLFVICFMKGVFNLRFFVFWYDYVWDVFIVLRYFRKLLFVKYLSLKEFICKFCMFICLICVVRV